MARLALADPDRAAPPAVVAAAPFTFPVPEQLTLADGAPVWLVERHETPLVRVMLNLSAGTVGAEDPVAARVLARALQDWREVRPAASAALEDLGASLRLGLSSGRLWVEIEALSGTEAEALERGWGALFAARAPLSHETVRRASQVQDDLDATLGLDPDAAHERALLELSYPWDHPIRLSQPGQSARRLGRRAAAAQWRGLLRARAALLVVGDTDAARILPILEAAWPGLGGAVLPAPLPTPPPVRETLALVDRPGARQARITAAFAAPGAFDAELPDAELVSMVLGGGLSGRLNHRLREQLGLSYGVSSALRVWPGHGWLLLDLEVEAARVGEAVAELRAILSALAADGPTEDELLAAQRGRRRAEAEATATLSGLSLHLGVAQGWGQAADWRAVRLSALAATTRERVSVQARTMLNKPAIFVISGDAALLGPALRSAGLQVDLVRRANTD